MFDKSLSADLLEQLASNRPSPTQHSSNQKDANFQWWLKKNITDVADKVEIDRRVTMRIDELRKSGQTFKKHEIVKEIRDAFKYEKWGQLNQTPLSELPHGLVQSTPKLHNTRQSSNKIIYKDNSESNDDNDEYGEEDPNDS